MFLFLFLLHSDPWVRPFYHKIIDSQSRMNFVLQVKIHFQRGSELSKVLWQGNGRTGAGTPFFIVSVWYSFCQNIFLGSSLTSSLTKDV